MRVHLPKTFSPKKVENRSNPPQNGETNQTVNGYP